MRIRRARVLTTSRIAAPEPTFRELFTPKLVTVLREGYDLRKVQADALAALTVAIVALPLSMAIAIASGVTPGRGLYTAIVAGFIISALGGSRFQVGGPAGAFIPVVAIWAPAGSSVKDPRRKFMAKDTEKAQAQASGNAPSPDVMLGLWASWMD